MSDSDKVFSGSIPEFYDTYLVPLIFEACANDLAERVSSLSPQAVLETAAGSGVVTRALAKRLAITRKLMSPFGYFPPSVGATNHDRNTSNNSHEAVNV